jgi:hypothetical protein
MQLGQCTPDQTYHACNIWVYGALILSRKNPNAVRRGFKQGSQQ